MHGGLVGSQLQQAGREGMPAGFGMRRFDRWGVLGWDVRVRRGAVRITVRDVPAGGVRRGLRGGVQGPGQLLRARAVRWDDGGVPLRGGVDRPDMFSFWNIQMF